MISNKPYLWLGKSGSTYTLEIAPTTSGAKFKPSVQVSSNRYTLTYVQDPNYTPIPTSVTISNDPNFVPAQHSKVTVVIKNASNQIIGSCTVLTALADTNAGSIHPQLWLKFNNTSDYDLYVYGHNGNISFTNPHYGDLNGTRTVSFNNTGPAIEQTEPLDNSTAFDPGAISIITVKISGSLGETSTGTSDADGSGDDDLLDDFF
jgi:hypothetical protein